MEPAGSVTDIAGVRVGHWTDREAATGCTVVLVEGGAVGGVDVRGAAPGSRETELLRAGMLVERVHAVTLTGGSAFGLAAADGVTRYLEERGVGFDTRVARVPIVPAAVLFDLGVGSATVRPTAQSGYDACLVAGLTVAEGSVGAGTGATVAK
ncbi:MAG: P1 family peptidase, partial [Dehalococcoidia bacterium]|nr:P1 family peptidase [Dehalococcoidia bacterium]